MRPICATKTPGRSSAGSVNRAKIGNRIPFPHCHYVQAGLLVYRIRKLSDGMVASGMSSSATRFLCGHLAFWGCPHLFSRQEPLRRIFPKTAPADASTPFVLSTRPCTRPIVDPSERSFIFVSTHAFYGTDRTLLWASGRLNGPVDPPGLYSHIHPTLFPETSGKRHPGFFFRKSRLTAPSRDYPPHLFLP